ncbi:HAD family hydrolase [Gordonia sp. ABKF26]|uniref:HAD family hydrolase n=1 Tax=Gordonia sp. ABKF26 TaxID=3238687 RepID=UPI0034E5CA5B
MNCYLFDIDGTIIASAEGHKDSFAVAFNQVVNVDVSIHEVEFSGCTDFEIIQRLATSHSIELSRDNLVKIENTMTRYYASVSRNIEIEPVRGTEETLLRLRDAGHRIELLSGNLREIAHAKLEKAGLWHLFDSGTFGDYAPNRNDLVKSAISGRADRNFNERFVVGDTPKDVVAAVTNGLSAIAVLTGGYDEKTLVDSGASVVLDSVADLISLDLQPSSAAAIAA